MAPAAGIRYPGWNPAKDNIVRTPREDRPLVRIVVRTGSSSAVTITVPAPIGLTVSVARPVTCGVSARPHCRETSRSSSPRVSADRDFDRQPEFPQGAPAFYFPALVVFFSKKALRCGDMNKNTKGTTRVSLFTSEVLKVVGAIPKGRILSYQMVARKAGRPNAARAVGSIMKRNYDPAIPCHRVVPSSAFVPGTSRLISTNPKVIAHKLGQYNRGHEKKVALLIAEGAIG